MTPQEKDIIYKIRRGEIDVNSQQLFMSILLKGLLWNLNQVVKVRNIQIPHFIINTGDDIMYLEVKGQDHSIEPLEVSNENYVYNTIPRCLVTPQGLSIPTDDLTSPYSTGSFQYESGENIYGYVAEFRRMPLEVEVGLKYYFDNYTDVLECMQQLLAHCAFINLFDIQYLGQTIHCSYKLADALEGEYQVEFDGITQDSKNRYIEFTITVESNMPIIYPKTAILGDAFVKDMRFQLDVPGDHEELVGGIVAAEDKQGNKRHFILSTIQYGANIDMELEPDNILTLKLLDQNNQLLGKEQKVRLPIGAEVIRGVYHPKSGDIMLFQSNDKTISISLNALIDRMQEKITLQNPISADFLIDGVNNKVFTEKEERIIKYIPEDLGKPGQILVVNDDGTELIYTNIVGTQSDWEQEDPSAPDYIMNMPGVFRNLPDIPDIPDVIVDGTIIERIVQDYDGNWYDGVVIGEQIWLTCNLKTKHYIDGVPITYGDNNLSTSVAYYYYPDNNQETIETYGLLYNYKVIDESVTHKLFQKDWSIPSYDDFVQLKDYVGSVSANQNPDGSSWSEQHPEYYIAKSLCSKHYWNSIDRQGCPGFEQQTNNNTGFNATPSGTTYSTVDATISYFGELAVFWSNTPGVPNGAGPWCLLISYNEAQAPLYMRNRVFATSIRCVCNMSASDWIAENKNRFYLKATSNGMVWSRISEVAETGSYNDLTDKPTIPAAQVQSDWNESDSSSAAFIKNKPTIPDALTIRTMNGEQLTDSSLGDINIHDGFYFPNAVQDYDGNWYGAVVIGNQVWLAENIRTTHEPDGTPIPTAPLSPNYSAAIECYHANNDPDNDQKYGLLYSIQAVLNGENFDDSLPSTVQGIAPQNWHIPSFEEFKQLVHYLKNQIRFNVYPTHSEPWVAKAIASTYGWATGSGWYTPSFEPEKNNTAGLNLPPAGFGGSSSSSGYGFSSIANVLTSSTPNSGYYAKAFYFEKNSGYVSVDYAFSGNFTGVGSVRCVSNLTPVQFRNWYIEQYGSLQHHIPSGAGVNLPVPTISDAGKILSVDENGNYILINPRDIIS